jgi:hypothetical protein
MALVNKYKNGELAGTIMICRNPLCNKAVDLDNSFVNVIKSEDFDTYIFYCPYCNKVLALDYEFKDGKTLEDIQCPYSDI